MSADALLTAAPVHALTVVAFIGAITALMGALIAVGQNDIKRILAFSTVSQLGYMMLAVGVGAWTAAIFHLLTHAFFKALLFLGAGSVIHAAHHEQDIRCLGGLAPRMKLTFATFAIGMMALAGVPFLFSGFWSKEAILHAAHTWELSQLPLYAGLAAVVLTAFYMTRLIAEVFFGRSRSDAAAHAHESPAVMTVPLVLLAAGAIFLGFLGTPACPWVQSRLDGTQLHSGFSHLVEGSALMLLSIILVGAGLGLGWWLYGRRPRVQATDRDPLATAAPAVMAAFAHRLGFDELYAATFGRLNTLAAQWADTLDRHVIGGLVDFLAKFGRFSGGLNRELDEAGLNAGFDRVNAGLRGSGVAYSKAQSGEPQGYLRVLAIAFVVLAFVLIMGGVR
jgi:NADH-quinone oxidoreductase subunit L